jgi:hypothetical protein
LQTGLVSHHRPQATTGNLYGTVGPSGLLSNGLMLYGDQLPKGFRGLSLLSVSSIQRTRSMTLLVDVCYVNLSTVVGMWSHLH